jgi:hypothetical protein
MTSMLFALLSTGAKAEYRFRSPAQDVYCSMNPDYVTCDVIDHAWKNWGCSDAGCFGHRFTLPAQGSASARRSSDTLAGSAARTLGHGFRLSNGVISCDSRQDGFTCTNQHGGRMHLNQKTFELK